MKIQLDSLKTKFPADQYYRCAESHTARHGNGNCLGIAGIVTLEEWFKCWWSECFFLSEKQIVVEDCEVFISTDKKSFCSNTIHNVSLKEYPVFNSYSGNFFKKESQKFRNWCFVGAASGFWEQSICCSISFSWVARFGACLKTAPNLSWNGCLILQIQNEVVTSVFAAARRGQCLARTFQRTRVLSAQTCWGKMGEKMVVLWAWQPEKLRELSRCVRGGRMNASVQHGFLGWSSGAPRRCL